MWSQFAAGGGPPPPPPPGGSGGFPPPPPPQESHGGGVAHPPPPFAPPAGEPASQPPQQQEHQEQEYYASDNDSHSSDEGGLGMTVNMVTSAASMLFSAARPLANAAPKFAPPPPPQPQFAPPPPAAAPAPIEQFASMLDEVDEDDDEGMTEIDMDAGPEATTAPESEAAAVFGRPPTPTPEATTAPAPESEAAAVFGRPPTPTPEATAAPESEAAAVFGRPPTPTPPMEASKPPVPPGGARGFRPPSPAPPVFVPPPMEGAPPSPQPFVPPGGFAPPPPQSPQLAAPSLVPGVEAIPPDGATLTTPVSRPPPTPPRPQHQNPFAMPPPASPAMVATNHNPFSRPPPTPPTPAAAAATATVTDNPFSRPPPTPPTPAIAAPVATNDNPFSRPPPTNTNTNTAPPTPPTRTTIAQNQNPFAMPPPASPAIVQPPKQQEQLAPPTPTPPANVAAAAPPPIFEKPPPTPNPPPPEALFSQPPPTPAVDDAGYAADVDVDPYPSLQEYLVKQPTRLVTDSDTAVAVAPGQLPPASTPSLQDYLVSQPPRTKVDSDTAAAVAPGKPPQAQTSSVPETVVAQPPPPTSEVTIALETIGDGAAKGGGENSPVKGPPPLHRVTPPASPAKGSKKGHDAANTLTPLINNQSKSSSAGATAAAAAAIISEESSKTIMLPPATTSSPKLVTTVRKLQGPPPRTTIPRPTRSKFKLPTPRKAGARTPVRGSSSTGGTSTTRTPGSSGKGFRTPLPTPTQRGRLVPSPSPRGSALPPKKRPVETPCSNSEAVEAAAPAAPEASASTAVAETTAKEALSIPPMDHAPPAASTDVGNTKEDSTTLPPPEETSPVPMGESAAASAAAAAAAVFNTPVEVTPPAPEEIPPSMPEGWAEATDPTTQQIYFYNSITGETVWERPVAANTPQVEDATKPLETTESSTPPEEEASKPAAQVEQEISNGMPEGWEEVTDPNTQQIYYYNSSSGETSWERPATEKATKSPEHTEIDAMETKPEGPPDTEPKTLAEPSSVEASPPAEEEKLPDNTMPEGWEEATDPSTQQVYYYNSISGETAWERPSMTESPAKEEPEISRAAEQVQEEESAPEEEATNSSAEAKRDGEDPNAEIPPVAEETSDLPEGWVEATDPSTQEVYYYNSSTGETAWERPAQAEGPTTEEISKPPEEPENAAEETPVEESPPEEEPTTLAETNTDDSPAKETCDLPDGWVEATDPTTQQAYYYNSITGETAWDRPAKEETPAIEEEKALEQSVEPEIAVEQSGIEEDSPPEEEPTAAAANVNDEVSPAVEEEVPNMPEGWEEATDPTTQQLYYYNSITGETAWERPSLPAASKTENAPDEEIKDATPEVIVEETVVQSPSGDQNEALGGVPFEGDNEGVTDPLPNEWTESVDPSSGQTYYYNSVSGETSWERPTDTVLESTKGTEPKDDQATEPEPEKTAAHSEETSDESAENVSPEKEIEPAEEGDAQPEQKNEEDALPEGWIEETDPVSGNLYYYHSESGTVSWDRPGPLNEQSNLEQKGENSEDGIDLEPEVASSESDLAEDKEPLPEGWIESFDPQTKNVYYYNSVTGDVSWEIPGKEDDVVEEEETVDDNPQLDDQVETSDEDLEPEVATESVSSAPKDPLPDGWIEDIDPKTEQVYYYNTLNGDVSWERPACTPIPGGDNQSKTDSVDDEGTTSEIEPELSNQGADPNDALPKDWEEVIDPSTGDAYFYNSTTGETSWERPEVVDQSPEEEKEDGIQDSNDAPSVTEEENEKLIDKNKAAPSNVPSIDETLDALMEDFGVNDNSPQEETSTDSSSKENLLAESSTDANELPEGWVQELDPTSGQDYFYNTLSGETSWERPSSEAGAAASTTEKEESTTGEVEDAVYTTDPEYTENIETENPAEPLQSVTGIAGTAAEEECLPDGWVKAFDPSSGQPYYYSETSGEISWERPAMVDPTEKTSAADDEANDEQTDEQVLADTPSEGGPENIITASEVEPEFAVETVTEPSELPANWEQIDDPSSGTYYYNSATGETSWDRPTDETEAEETQIEEPPAIEIAAVDDKATSDAQANETDTNVGGDDWVESTDPSTGNVYYYNSKTGKTSWEKPNLSAIEAEGPGENVPEDANDHEGHPIESSVESANVNIVESNEPDMKDDNPDSPPPHSSLPDGWEEVLDATSGKVSYYQNNLTNAITFTKPEPTLETEDTTPTEDKTPEPSDKKEAEDASNNEIGNHATNDALPEGWAQMEDPSSGQVYYYNSLTEETTWERPSVIDSPIEGVAATNDSQNLNSESDEANQLDEKEAAESPLEVSRESKELVAEADGESEDIPNNWVTSTDPSSGKKYYYNIITEEVSWDFPKTEVPASDMHQDKSKGSKETNEEHTISETNPSSNSVTNALADGWEEMEDPSSGQKYYYNAESGETSWERPNREENCEEAEPNSAQENVQENVQDAGDVVEDGLADKDEDDDQGENVATSDLPAGWEELEDPSSGQIYYFNSESGETSWEHPTAVETGEAADAQNNFAEQVAGIPPDDFEENEDPDAIKEDGDETEYAAATDALPAGWEEVEDPSSGEIYFYHAESGETSWERPTAQEAEENEEAEDLPDDDEGVLPDDVVEAAVHAGEGDNENTTEALPVGWEEVEDPSTGEIYFYHAESGETSWERPTAQEAEENEEAEDLPDDAVEAAVHAGEGDNENTTEALPVGWEEVEDPSTGEIYFYHAESGETSWERPTAQEAEENEEAEDLPDDDEGVLPDDAVEAADHAGEGDNENTTEALPAGWEEVEDPSTGEIYFYHAESGETSWERPTAQEAEENEEAEDLPDDDEGVLPDDVVEAAVHAGEGDNENTTEALPAGWEEVEDPSTGEIYFYHAESGETSWERPTAAAAAETGEEEEEAEDPPEDDEGVLRDDSVDAATNDLPAGWEEVEDPTSGEIYFYHAESGETSWEHPTAAAAAETGEEEEAEDLPEDDEGVLPDDAVDAATNDLPGGWEEVEDPSSGEIYFYHAESGETSWERPTAQEAEETEEAEDPPEDDEGVLRDDAVEAADHAGEGDNENTTEALPAGWEEVEDPSTGEIYFYHAESGETSWERPGAIQTDQVSENEPGKLENDIMESEDAATEDDADIVSGELPVGWEEVEDSNGQIYYYNTESGKTSWEKPSFEPTDDEEQDGKEEYENGNTAVEDMDLNNHEDDKGASCALPEGWTEVEDTSSGEVYYYNADSGETSWERPKAEDANVDLTDSNIDKADENEVDLVIGENSQEQKTKNVPDSLPEGWVESRDPDSGEVYYYHSESGEVSWERPSLTLTDTSVHEISEEITFEPKETDNDGELLEGWVENEDPASGKVYYYHSKSGDVCWEKPTNEAMETEEPDVREGKISEELESDTKPIDNSGELPDGWVESEDPSSGDIYYYHAESGETSWERPTTNSGKKDLSIVEEAEDEDHETNPIVDMSEAAENEDPSLPGPLPELWVESKDPDSGEPYYFNSLTQEVRWERPTAEESEEKDSILPEDWIESTDPTSGETYYYNCKTEETSWERPVHSSMNESEHNENKQEPADNGTSDPSIENDDSQQAGSEMSGNWVEVEDRNDDWVDVQEPISEDDMNFPEDENNASDQPISDLPDGWVESIDPSSGQTFYWNETTNETLWDRPKENALSSSSGHVASQSPKLAPVHNVSNIEDIEHERKKFGVSGPFTLCDDSVVTTYIMSKAQSEDILWQLIAIAVQSKGRLRSDSGVADKSGPEAAIVKLLLGSPNYVNHSRKSKNDVVIEEKIDDERERKDSIVKVEDLLIRGDREHAIEEAILIGDFATALLVASMCGPDTYRRVARKYAESKFRSDSPMYTTTMLFSGKVEAPSSRRSGNWGVNPEELRKNWKSHLASIINNRTSGWDKIVISLGDRLDEIGYVQEAHFCYMVCGYPITSPVDEETRVALLGCNHSESKNRSLLTGESLVAYERTEAYEWAKRLGNQHAYFATFQPFKLIYAMLLADRGELIQSQKFVQSIQISPDKARTAASDIREVSVDQMFNNDVAFELAYNEIEQQLVENGSESKYGESLLTGGYLKITAPKSQMISTNASPQISKDLDRSSSISQGWNNEQQLGSPNATFMTAKSNLMDVSGYTVDDTKTTNSDSLKDKMAPSSTKPSEKKSFPSTSQPAEQQSVAAIARDTKTPQQSKQQERPKAAPATAPAVMTGKKKEEKPKPATPAPASSGKPKKAPGSGAFGGMKSWLIKKLNPDAQECFLPDNEEQPYYDKDLKRWIFPGDDPAEVAKPLAPPPMTAKKEDVAKDEPKENAKPESAASRLMAPPPSRIPGKKRIPSAMGSPMMGGMMMPPVGGAPQAMMTPRGLGGAATPKFSTFTPKAAVFTPKPAVETPAPTEQGDDEPGDDQ